MPQLLLTGVAQTGRRVDAVLKEEFAQSMTKDLCKTVDFIAK